MLHADTTPEQIISYTKDAWREVASYFQVAHPDRDEPDIEVSQIEDDLRAVLRKVHGPKAIISCYLPYDVVAFHEVVDRTVITQELGRWDFELFGRRFYAGPDEDLDDEQRAAIEEHGMWHWMGRYNDKHELWICVDRQRDEYGKVFDLNDGSPRLTGRLVPDRVYEMWLDFLIAIKSWR